MSWQKQKQKKNEGPGIGTAVAVGVGAVGVAALAWGAKKLFDMMSAKETPAAQGHGTTGASARSRGDFRDPGTSWDAPAKPAKVKPVKDTPVKDSPVKVKVMTPPTPSAPEICAGWEEPEAENSTSSATSSPSSACAPLNLTEDDDVTPSIIQNEMIDYYDNYVHVPKRAGRQAMHVANDVIKMIQGHVETRCPGLTEEFIGTGSAFDGTQIIRPENYDVLIPIRTPEDDITQWTSLDGRESLGWESASGFSLVVLDDAESYYSQGFGESLIIDDRFLSPMKARIYFREMIQSAVIDHPAPYHLSVSSSGSVTSVNVMADVGDVTEMQLVVNFMPAVRVGGRLLTADPYPRCEQEHDTEEGYKKLWQECFAVQEAEKLASLPLHDSCHLRALKILKAICRNDPAHLGKLSSYLCKTLLFLLMDREADWTPGKLGERVPGLLRLLEFYLRERRLPHYFLPGVNLLEGFGRHELDDLTNYVTSILRKNNLSDLLKTEY